MNIEKTKEQAKSLAKVLADLNIATISTPQALDIVSNMLGHKNWQAALGSQKVDNWNRLQQAIYSAYPHSDLLGLDVGADLSDYTGDSMFVAIMLEAAEQPASRVYKALGVWRVEITNLQLIAQGHVLAGAKVKPGSLDIPNNLPEEIQEFLLSELGEKGLSLADAVMRLGNVARDLAAVQTAVARVMHDIPDTILVVQDDFNRDLHLVVPSTMSLEEARDTVDGILTEAEFGDQADARAAVLLDYEGHVLKQRFVDAQLIPLNVVHSK